MESQLGYLKCSKFFNCRGRPPSYVHLATSWQGQMQWLADRMAGGQALYRNVKVKSQNIFAQADLFLYKLILFPWPVFAQTLCIFSANFLSHQNFCKIVWAIKNMYNFLPFYKAVLLRVVTQLFSFSFISLFIYNFKCNCIKFFHITESLMRQEFIFFVTNF